ncbi:MAG: tetratricopeptide repeat protein [Deltaproteobacteria bacterium]|nr:tetratricopeptide repeat protein [Deltaproteobacteria bacterium]
MIRKKGGFGLNAIIILTLLGLILLTMGCAGTSLQGEDKAQTHLKLGDSYLKSGDFTRALKELLEAAKLDPNNAEIQNILGAAYMSKEVYPEAIKHFQNAQTLKSDYSEAYNNLGIVYVRMGEYDKAIEQFQAAVKNLLYPTPQYAWCNMGLAYHQKGDYHKAIACYQGALKSTPRFVPALNGIAQSYEKLGKLSLALENYRLAVMFDAKFPDAHYNLGLLQAKMGQMIEARASFESVVSLSPDSNLGRKAQRYIDDIKAGRPVR